MSHRHPATSLFAIVALSLLSHHSALGKNPRLDDQSSSGFDAALAERLVNYAGASYCAGQPAVKDWTCYACSRVPGFQNITSVHDPKTDGRAIVGYDPQLGARIVAFMGTNINIKTWIDDILVDKLAPYPWGGCEVHHGFYATYQGIRQQVYDALIALPPGKTYITGHSLGGALATLCALDLSEKRDIHADSVITVGQPRVGNKAFAAYYASRGLRHYRVTHHRDPVPHLPYEAMNYEHITTEVYYEDAQASSPTRICSPTNGEDPACADQFNGNVIFIPDHWNYLKFSFAVDLIHCTIGRDMVHV